MRATIVVALAVCAGIVHAFPPPAGGGVGQADDPGVLESVAVRADEHPRELIVSLRGTIPLDGSLRELSDRQPFRVFLDLPGVVPAVADVTPVGRGAVERIRVALHQSNPPVTRVVVDMAGRQPYRIERGSAGKAAELRIIIGPGHPAAAREYIRWFRLVAARAARLLVARSMVQPTREGAAAEPAPRDWNDLAADAARRTPPDAFHAAHHLLQTAVRLGAIAAGEHGADGQPGSAKLDRSTAGSGAKLLLARASALVTGGRD